MGNTLNNAGRDGGGRAASDAPQPPRSWADVAQVASVNRASRPNGAGGASRLSVHQPKLRRADNVRNCINMIKDSAVLTTINDDQSAETSDQVKLALSFKFDAECAGKIKVYIIAEQSKMDDGPLFSSKAVFEHEFTAGKAQQFDGKHTEVIIDVGQFSVPDLLYHKGSDTTPVVVELSRSPQVESETSNCKLADSQCVYFTLAKSQEEFAIKELQRSVVVEKRIYIVKEMYGSLATGEEIATNELDTSKECVVCLSESRNTTILPCMHMCLCVDCASRLTIGGAKCPLCRTDIQEFWQLASS
mmetsp:Transcript_9608/g.15744  ORF Transcript_9608/g.15744 Transcript_9608/m.15744 type:complete len:303 (-) Transcript_9608:74-982(-)